MTPDFLKCESLERFHCQERYPVGGAPHPLADPDGRYPTGAVDTIGYAEEDAAQRVAHFLHRPRTALIDIRLRPWSRWAWQWNKSSLLVVYGRFYLHMPEFGNMNYKTRGAPIRLKDPDLSLARLVGALQDGYSLLLLCACKDYETCHRKTVHELLRTALAEAERTRQAELAKPRMDPDNQRGAVCGSLPDGRVICVQTEVFVSALGDMPAEILNDPQSWYECVDHQTVWLETREGIRL